MGDSVGVMKWAPNIVPGRQKAVMVHRISAYEQCAKYKKFVSLHGPPDNDGDHPIYHIHHRRDWERFRESGLLILRQTNVVCHCSVSKYRRHLLWEFED